MLRADALATLYLFHPLRKLVSRPEERLPILMYHSISASNDGHTHPYYRTVTTPQVFERHMKFLHDNGYSGVRVSDAVSRSGKPGQASGQLVAITFDDGYRDFYSEAFPVLRKYGFSATMYLPTAYIERFPQAFKGIECLTWNQVRELRSAGIEFGSHTVTHPQLKSLGNNEIAYELGTSKDMIEQELGCAVKSFAYPYSFPETDRPFAAKVRRMIGEAGYENSVSTIIGTANRTGSRFFMKRLPVNSCDDTRLFTAKLDGSYDWLHAVQYAFKLVASRH